MTQTEFTHIIQTLDALSPDQMQQLRRELDVKLASMEERPEAGTDLGSIGAMRDDAEFVRIDSALQRLAHGDYGVCSDCGESIDDARLLAEPTAQRCTACQQRFEHTHR